MVPSPTTTKSLSIRRVLYRSGKLFLKHGLPLTIFLALFVLVVYSFILVLSIVSEMELGVSGLMWIRVFEAVGTLFILMVFLVSAIALIKGIHQAACWDRVDTVAAYREALSAVPGVLKVLLLSTIGVVGWSLLLFVPGLIASFDYSLAVMVYLVDNVGGREALRLSRGLVRRNLLKLFVFFMLFIFMMGFVVFKSLFFWDAVMVELSSPETVFLVAAIEVLEAAIVLTAFLLTYVFFYFIYQESKSE